MTFDDGYGVPKRVEPKSTSITTVIGVRMTDSQKAAARRKAAFAVALLSSCEVPRRMIFKPVWPVWPAEATRLGTPPTGDSSRRPSRPRSIREDSASSRDIGRHAVPSAVRTMM